MYHQCERKAVATRFKPKNISAETIGHLCCSFDLGLTTGMNKGPE